MTDQELSQIRQIIREEIAAQLPPRLDRAVEAMGTDFSELRQETIRRFDLFDRRLESLERRMDRVADTNAALSAEISALNRWANRIDRDNTEIHATQAAQQRAIDALVKRWTGTPPEA